jgi:hypothetical protein
MVHPIIMGHSHEPNNFQPSTWKPRGLHLRLYMQSVYAFSRYSPLKGVNTLWGHCDAHFGITCILKPIQKWNNTINHVGGNIGVVLSYLLLQMAQNKASLSSFGSSYHIYMHVSPWSFVFIAKGSPGSPGKRDSPWPNEVHPPWDYPWLIICGIFST